MSIDESRREARERSRRQPRVLLVDDHAGFVAQAQALLAADGYDVVGTASDGHAAIEAAARLRPDLILLDVQLPDIDGFETASRLRSVVPAAAIVLVSTRSRADFGERLRTPAIDGFIAKIDLDGSAIRALVLGRP